MNATYGDLKVLVYVSVIGGGIAFFVMLYLVFIRSNAISQEYMYFYCYVLLVLVIMIVLLSMMISDMRKVFRVNREKLKTGTRCITDAGWKKVPTTMYNKTNMDSEHTWACVFLAFSEIMALVAAWFLYSITTALEKMNKPMGWVSN